MTIIFGAKMSVGGWVLNELWHFCDFNFFLIFCVFFFLKKDGHG
jgi:hypothetical protein